MLYKMTEKDFIPSDHYNAISSGVIHSKAPSNIALVKYWGKFPDQIPANPSVSFTLDTCTTSTRIDYQEKSEQKDKVSFEFLFERQPKPAFEPKLRTFFERTSRYLPLHLQVPWQLWQPALLNWKGGITRKWISSLPTWSRLSWPDWVPEVPVEVYREAL